MGAFGKRVRNMVKANLNEGLPPTPSVKSIVDTRIDLVKKYDQEIQGVQELQSKVLGYSHAMREWGTRVERAMTTKQRAPENTPAIAFDELQIYIDNAVAQKDIYTSAKAQAEENIKAKSENIEKMKTTIDQLYAYERKYALRASLERTSAELNTVLDPAIQQNESRQVAMAIHVAQALLELKEGESYHE